MPIQRYTSMEIFMEVHNNSAIKLHSERNPITGKNTVTTSDLSTGNILSRSKYLWFTAEHRQIFSCYWLLTCSKPKLFTLLHSP